MSLRGKISLYLYQHAQDTGCLAAVCRICYFLGRKCRLVLDDEACSRLFQKHIGAKDLTGRFDRNVSVVGGESDKAQRCSLEVNTVSGAVEDKSGIPDSATSEAGLTTKMQQPKLAERDSNNNVNSATVSGDNKWLTDIKDLVDSGNDECLRKVLDNKRQTGLIQDIPKQFRSGLINSCIKSDRYKVLEVLLDNGIITGDEELDEEKNSPLCSAIKSDATGCVRVLIDKAKNFENCMNSNYEYPIHVAIKMGKKDILEHMTNKYPSMLKLKDGRDFSLIQFAAEVGCLECLDYLLNSIHGNELKKQIMPDDEWGKLHNALKTALKNKNYRSLILLARSYPDSLADPDIILLTLLNNGEYQIFQTLCEICPQALIHRNDIIRASLDYKYPTPLHWAFIKGDIKLQKELLTHPIIEAHLNRIDLFSDLKTISPESAELLAMARKKHRLPKRLLNPGQQSATVTNIVGSTHKNLEKNQSIAHSRTIDVLDLSHPDKAFLTHESAESVLKSLPFVEVYVRCRAQSSEQEGQFYTVGDESSGVDLVKQIAAMGARDISLVCSPADDSLKQERDAFSEDELKKYRRRNRVALSKLALLLPEIDVDKGTPQKIKIGAANVTIYNCDDDYEEAPLTLSFLKPASKVEHTGKIGESYIVIRPYRFETKYQAVYTDINEDCRGNIINLAMPTNTIIPQVKLGLKGKSSGSDSVGSTVAAKNTLHLCALRESDSVDMSVVYGLHHQNIDQNTKMKTLSNWVYHTKNYCSERKPTVITLSSNQKISIEQIRETFQGERNVRVVDMCRDDAKNVLDALGSEEVAVCLIPSLPQPVFHEMIHTSNLPALSEGANLTSLLLESGRPHLSLLPEWFTPVAYDMGNPLEAIKAEAFACKLRIGKGEIDSSSSNTFLEQLHKYVTSEQYDEAMLMISDADQDTREILPFLYRNSVPSINSLLSKGVAGKLGDFGKQALLSAFDTSDQAWQEYLAASMDKESSVHDHFQLQKMHVTKPFMNNIAFCLMKFGQYKGLMH